MRSVWRNALLGGFFASLCVMGWVPSASAQTYEIDFTSVAGGNVATLPTSGTFQYDTSTSEYTTFSEEWDTLTFTIQLPIGDKAGDDIYWENFNRTGDGVADTDLDDFTSGLNYRSYTSTDASDDFAYGYGTIVEVDPTPELATAVLWLTGIGLFAFLTMRKPRARRLPQAT